jgi:MFS family permease
MTQGIFRLAPSTIIVLAGVAAALHVGKLPPALPVLQQALNLTLMQASFLLSMMQLAGMTLGLAVGLSADALGLRRCMLSGLALLTFASALGSQATTIEGLLMLRALEGLGFLLVVMPAPALIRRNVSALQLSASLGWWGTYMPLGSALALLLGPLVIAWLNWPSWWGLMAAATLLAWLAVWWRVPVPERSAAKAPIPEKQRWLQRLRLTLQSPGPWLVALSFAVYSAQWMSVIGFLPTIYQQAGLPAGLTGLLTAGVALVNVSGNVLAGRLLRRGLKAQRVLQFGFTCMALGTLGAFGQWQAEGLSFGARLFSVMLFSAVGGLIPGSLFSIALRLAPSEDTVSTTVGYMQQWSAFGQFAGPPLVAWVAASVGGWQWTWLVTGALCAGGILLAQLIAQVLRQEELTL